MKTIIVYSSQTGFTKRYVDWLSEELNADVVTIADAKKKNDNYFADADVIIYGGWAMGGKIVNSKWFTQNIPCWKGKKLVLFCVGASPNGSHDVETVLNNALTDEEKKYAKAFYCQGGLSYENMKLPSRLLIKAFVSMIRNKKNATEQEKEMGEMLAHSYDIADRKFIEPIVGYIRSV